MMSSLPLVTLPLQKARGQWCGWSLCVYCTRPGGLVWRALHLVHGPWSLFALPFALVATGPAQEQTSTGAQEADSEGTSLRPRDVPTLPGYLN